ncbi:hypothetical protein KFK09_004159 [Dendrobium nobile]|uniref:Reverse transcriptase domain-containing protein n=1 Tax=Dendrobium nobile TaxID=94219 RepID=A0A8T3C251_DENNO|nr:hypothetical protein KFK09_004159 [Dendrobium nobile]
MLFYHQVYWAILYAIKPIKSIRKVPIPSSQLDPGQKKIVAPVFRLGKIDKLLFHSFAVLVPLEELEMLWRVLEKKGVNNAFIQIIKDMYAGAITCVQTQVMNVLTRKLLEDVPWCMLFADDILLVDKTREGVEDKLNAKVCGNFNGMMKGGGRRDCEEVAGGIVKRWPVAWVEDGDVDKEKFSSALVHHMLLRTVNDNVIRDTP